jgi:hypothetical protein
MINSGVGVGGGDDDDDDNDEDNDDERMQQGKRSLTLHERQFELCDAVCSRERAALSVNVVASKDWLVKLFSPDGCNTERGDEGNEPRCGCTGMFPQACTPQRSIQIA